ncbi:hypothetical protein BLTE_12580 [Blastochloris tepida]|uniref:Uncharacterized protein n=1 Tax=Blastochloris tepida TaxID=2233851 RepID=A0A348FZ40_9HYPH|nr:hypothetical protein BLTE_12580 [Blastochloris tepida]
MAHAVLLGPLGPARVRAAALGVLVASRPARLRLALSSFLEGRGAPGSLDPNPRRRHTGAAAICVYAVSG